MQFIKIPFLLLITFFAMAQTDLKTLWIAYEEAEMDDKPRTQAEILDKILKICKEKKLTTDYYKAFFLKLEVDWKLTMEQNDNKIFFTTLYKELETAQPPLKNLAYFSAAKLLTYYFDEHSFAILDRTSANVQPDPYNPETWDADYFVHTINSYLLKALEDEELLKNEPAKKYLDILKLPPEDVEYQTYFEFAPTLFDILVFDAIRIWQAHRVFHQKDFYSFTIKDTRLFSPIPEFLKYPLENVPENKRNNLYYILLYYQKLLAFHFPKDAKQSIFIETERLEFLKAQIQTEENIAKLYLQTLQADEELFPDEPFRFYFRSKLLYWYYSQGKNFHPTLYNKTAPQRKYLVKVVNEVWEIIDQNPDLSDLVLNNLTTMTHAITATRNLFFTVNDVYFPEKSIPVKIEYQNYDSAYVKIYSLSFEKYQKLEEEINQHWRERRKFINTFFEKEQLPFKEYAIDLKNPKDYLPHSAEFLLDPLKKGFYVVVLTDQKEIAHAEELEIKGFWITELSYRYEYDKDKEEFQLQVLRRENASPVKDALVEVTLKYASHSGFRPASFSGKTDADGHIRYKLPKHKTKSLTYFYVKIQTPDDQYRAKQYIRHPRQEITPSVKGYLFTDRAIYRPGQIIYFKGIVIKPLSEKEHTPVAKKKVIVKLIDANYKTVQELSFITDEYGSFHGSFVVPKDRLTGRWQISFSYNQKTFHKDILIEEYKIPKFFVEIQSPEKEYKIGEKVTLKGKVLSYAGIPLSDTKVNINIYRQTFLPHRWWWFWRYSDIERKVFLVNKEVKTNSQGEFEFTFKLVGDLQADKKLKPLFSYEIFASATDETGETQTTSLSLSAAYDPFSIFIDLVRDSLEGYKYREVKIRTSNASGKELKLSGKIKIYKLKTPERLLLSRNWSLPDISLLAPEEFKKKAPEYPFLDENIPETWKEEKLVFQTDIQSFKPYSLKAINSAGVYKIVVEIPFKGKKYSQARILIFNDFKKKKLAYPQYLAVYKNTHIPLKPGDKAQVMFMSSVKDLHIYYKYASFGIHSQEKVLKLSNGFGQWNYKIQKKDKGNLRFAFVTIVRNKPYSKQFTFRVPRYEYTLKYQWKRFRNKLKPGENVEFELILSDYNGKPVSAGLLATMYNQALDSYKSNYWEFYTYSVFYENVLVPEIPVGTSRYNLFTFHLHRHYLPFFHIYIPSIKVRNVWQSAYLYDYDSFGVEDLGEEDEFAGGEDEFAVSSAPKRSAKSAHKKSLEIKTLAPEPETPQETPKEIQIRKDLKETAFFYPNLYTNEAGNIVIKFQAPEALSTWKFMALAYTKSLQSVLWEEKIITQKEIMIEPFFPRFFREGDEIIITARISTPEVKSLQGNSKLEILDPATEKPVANINIVPLQTAWKLTKEKQNTLVKWKIKLPNDLSSQNPVLMYRVYAWTKEKEFSDGEQNILPVLSNRKLLTEAMPITISKNGTHTFTFKSVEKVFNSSTATPYSYTFEYTPNPVWYAIQSMPYLMEFPHECYEQLFNRFYANSIAYNIMKNNPTISRVLEVWKNYQPDALLSKLEKNQELKQLLIEETPWLFEASRETEQKRRLALLMDFNKMSNELAAIIQRLEKGQKPSGGFPWFDGMKSSEFVTTYIVGGFGRLQHLGILNTLDEKYQQKIQHILPKAIDYIDEKAEEGYMKLKSFKSFVPEANHLSDYLIYYMYARSFFTEKEIPNDEMFEFYLYQMETYWNEISDFSLRSMLAVTLHRWKPESQVPAEILESFSEYLIDNNEVGCRFKNVYRGWVWYQNSLTTEVFTIEAFWEINKEKYADKIDCMKQWILNNKRLNAWETTLRTSDVIYIFLLTSPKVLKKTPQFTFYVGDTEVKPRQQEAGTGYFKKVWQGSDIKPEMANLKIVAEEVNITSWGSVFLQYFENLENIEAHAQKDLHIKREYFRVYTDPTGEKMEKISEKTPLKVGDEIVVRILISVGKNMSYVHLKDERGATLEPKDKFSGYKYRGGIGYYMAIKDAGVNFFIDYLPAGNYTLEYRLYVTHAGSFSSGIGVIQNMYAPEFTSHTAGQKLQVKEK